MSRQVILVRNVDSSKSQGLVNKSKVTEKNFEIIKEEIPKLEKDGSVLVQPLWISVDPYLRGRLPLWNDKPIISGQVVKIIESKNEDYPVHTRLFGYLPWSTHIIITKEELENGTITKIPPEIKKKKDEDEKINIPDLSKIPLSHYLGAFGMPGRTAYYGLIELGELNKDGKKKNILISGAAGAVGSIVGQIAKIYGHYVVGTAGSEDKLKWLKKIGFDQVLNYKNFKNIESCQTELKKVLPNGIDIYFDNTAGVVTDSVWDLINNFARVIICGQIAYYDNENIPKIDPFLHKLIYKQAIIIGLYQGNFKDFDRFHTDMGSWILESKIDVEETIIKGFEKLPQAFLGLFTGENTGKMVVQCEF